MGKFGWSYPPGCSGTPYDEERPCDMCGGMADHTCICPECPECGSVGDPACYRDHGLVESSEQRKNREDYLEACRIDNEAESAWFAEMDKMEDWPDA